MNDKLALVVVSSSMLAWLMAATASPVPPKVKQGSAELSRVVSTSPRLDLFLNLPKKCDRAYDTLIGILEKCRDGSDNGHPSLDYGCFLHINFEAPEFQCQDANAPSRTSQNAAILFPAVEDTPWHPSPKCEGTDCDDNFTPIWSGSSPTSDTGDTFDTGDIFGPDVSREDQIDYLINVLKQNRRKSGSNSS